MNLKNKDIIIVGLQPWDIPIGSNCKNIASELSKNNRVLYVNMPADRISIIKNKSNSQIQKRLAVLKGNAPELNYINDNLIEFNPKVVLESINWISNTKLFDSLNYLNNRKIAKAINKKIEELEFNNPILFNDNSFFKGFYFKELVNASFHIYYIRDFLNAQDYFKKHGRRLEPQLMAKSDLVVTNSTYLEDYAKKHNPKSKYIGQGCDFTGFDQPHEIPHDLRKIESPIIGYVGYLTSERLDIDLISAIAKSKPNYNIVLVGPEDEEFKNSNLHKLDNVHFLGAKNPNELAAYISGFDVCINPQLINELTIGNYPRKIDEYLALGKPTVATKTVAMEVFKDHVLLATSLNEYLENIEKALTQNHHQKVETRKSFAFSHTWENSVSELEKSIILI